MKTEKQKAESGKQKAGVRPRVLARRAARASDQANRLFLKLPVFHALEARMLEIKLNWSEIARLWQEVIA